MAEKSIFKDDVFSHIEDDVEKIRRKTGMYVPYSGADCAMHLVQELIDNVFDENNNPESPGDSCEVLFDENQNLIEVADNGRGLPFEQVVMVCTKIQSGSKFDRDNGDNSAGENGVGLTAINALSHYLKFTIHRQISEDESEKGVFEFSEGKFLGEKITESKKIKHGTRITMIPSEEILGSCKIDPDILLEWLQKLSYITEDIPIHVTIIRKGSDEPEKYKFKHKNGIVEYIETLAENMLFKPIVLEASSKADEIGSVQVAFTFDSSKLEETGDSFVNRINTIEGGQHVLGARLAIGTVLSKAVNDSLSPTDKKKFEVTYDDCRSGLVMVVNLSCRYPGYVGQQKEKCGNKALFTPIRSMIGKQLSEYLEAHPKTLAKIVGYLKKVAKSRLDVVKLRKSDMNGIDSFKSNKMANFSDATEDSDYNELYLIEGLSAKGSIMKARDPRFQAALSFKGVTANALFMSPAQIMQNPEYATLVKVSGLGIGKNFDIRKSRYKRYIISTDADIDGWKISSGIASFFLFHWPEVVDAGMLYVALTPLYMIDRGNGNYDYLVSKSALFEEKVKSYIKKAQIRTRSGHIMTPKEMGDFLIRNKNYEDILKELYTHEFVHPDIIEFIVGRMNGDDPIQDFRATFPEMKVETQNEHDTIFHGSYKGVYQFLMHDNIFEDKAEKLVDAYQLNGGHIYFDYKDNDSDTWVENISLGAILRNLRKYDLEIKHRWKGLGSIPPKIFWDIVMNPAKRSLIQLTVSDIERDMEMMRILHGPDASLRRDLLQSYKLDKDDIDS